jgi:homoserine O-acetyltransferase
MTESTHLVFRHPGAFALKSGRVLQGYHLAYHTYGVLNPARDNVVWVFHALTANSDPQAWWPGLVGPGCFFDPARYFIVCVNMPGSCYGSIGPLDEAPDSGRPFYHDFPVFTIRDMIRAYQPLRDALGIRSIRIGIGGSMGGQQLLEWAVAEPDAFEYIIPIATNAWHSAWGKAFNESQRWCIEADPSWKEASPLAGIEGMKIARSVALLSYRSYHTYELLQSDEAGGATANSDGPITDHGAAAGDTGGRGSDSNSRGAAAGESRVSSYQRYQGEKLARRFNAFSYYQLSRSMDSHRVGRTGSDEDPGARASAHEDGLHDLAATGKDGLHDPAAAAKDGLHDTAATGLSAARALARIRARALVIGLRSDMLFPLSEQQFLARHIPGARFAAIDSDYGHDGFLLEAEIIGKAVQEFILFSMTPAGR